MCYKAPGPRCSYHARKQLLAVKKKLDTIGVSKGIETYTSLKEELNKAELDFDSTPAGMANLELSIERGEDYDGSIAARLDYCRANREAMLVAIKSADKGDTGEHPDIPLPKIKDVDFPKDNQIRKPWSIRFARKKLEITYALHGEHVAKTLNLDETKALQWYSGDGFRHINPYLLKKHDENYEDNTHPMDKPHMDYPEEKISSTIKHMDSAFEKNRLDKPILTYRGLKEHNFPKNITEPDKEKTYEENQAKYTSYAEETYPEGSTHTFPYYLSTSVDPAQAQGFSNTKIMMEIKTRSALPLGFVSAWGDSEKEMLVQRDRKFKVIGVKKNIEYAGQKGVQPSRITVIQLEEID